MEKDDINLENEDEKMDSDHIKDTKDEKGARDRLFKDNEKSSVNESETDSKKDETEQFCLMCRRPKSIVGNMVNLPIGFPVCNDCMQRAFDAMRGLNEGDLSNLDLSRINLEVNNFDFKKFNPVSNNKESETEVKNNKAAKKKSGELEFELNQVPLPHQIKAELDAYVIGQDYAKKVISVAVYNHYKRIYAEQKNNTDVDIEKSNILMLGPTGSGKTYLVQTLARILNVPLALADATSLTEAGYIGDDIESVLSKLLAAAKGSVKRAEQGIVFVDEIDKIAKKKNAHQRDVSGESVQQGMLKLLEGAKIEVPVGASSKNAMVPVTTIDTKNILFICGGAFPDIESIIKERLNKQSSMGFMADLKDKYDDEPDLLKYVTAEDVRKYGMIPEFIGRLPILCHLQGLDKEMLIQILKEPRNAILKQYTKLLEMDEVDLKFSDDALDTIAKMAIDRKTGARALRAIIEEFMLDIMYEIPKDNNIGTVTITGDYIKGKTSPLIEMRLIERSNVN